MLNEGTAVSDGGTETRSETTLRASVADPHLRERVLAIRGPDFRKRPGLLNLSSNELSHPLAGTLGAAFLASADADAMRAYPDPSAWVARVAGHFGLPPESVLLTAGSDDAVRMVAALLGASTGRMLLQTPNYDNWATFARLFDVDVRPVEHGPHSVAGFPAALERALAESEPSLVVVANPNGFSGWCYPLETVARWAELCRERRHLLVIDEAYSAFAPIDHAPLVAGGGVLVVRSFSKSLGMAGMRMGMVAAEPRVADYLSRWQAGNPVSALGLAYLDRCLDHAADFARAQGDVAAAREWTEAALAAAAPSLRVHPSKANFVLLEAPDDATYARITAGFEAARIRVRPLGNVEGFERCIRVTVHERPVMERVVDLVARTAAAPDASA